jgi:DNA-directed RNA polymerase specialized sigma subunit
VAPDISPYYRVDFVQGVQLSGVDLIQAARAIPDSTYYSLDNLSRQIIDSRYPFNGQKPMTFKEISINFGITISQAYSLIKGVRAKLTGEVKLE